MPHQSPKPPHHYQRWIKPFGVVSLLASSYLLTQAAQAFEPFPQRLMQSHLQTGLSQLRQTRVQPLALISEKHLNPALSEGLKGRSLTQDMSLLSQNPSGSPAIKAPDATEPTPEPQVLVAEVVVEPQGGELPPELRDLVYATVQTRAGGTTTRSQLQQDINAIFTTGFFADVDARPEDTNLGVQVTFSVQPNPVLTDIQIVGNQVLPKAVVDRIFAEQRGRIINLHDLRDGIAAINQWYVDNDYILASVIESPSISSLGIAVLEVAEGVIEAIEVEFVDENGNTINEQGGPIQGETQEYVILREFQSRPGHIFNHIRLQRDLQRAFTLGFFEAINLNIEPGDLDPQKVKVIVGVTEKNTTTIAAGLGANLNNNVFLTGSYREDNLLGRGQKLGFETEIGLSETRIDAFLTSPGRLDGLPASPPELQGAVSAVITALNQPRTSRSEIIDKTEKLHRLSQVFNHKSLEALVLNNLASLYSDPVDDLKAYDQALELVRHGTSPALELYFLLRQAKTYRDLSEPQQALKNYTQALGQLVKLQKNSSLSSWLGEDMFELLSDEWQLENQGNLISDEDFAQALNVIKLGLFLDTTFTYSILGDYQAGLYMAGSRESENTTDSLANYLNNLLNDDRKIQSIIDAADPTGFNTSTFEALSTVLPNVRQFSQALLGNISEIYKHQTLKLLFSDFNEPESKAFQQEKIEAMGLSSRQQISLLFYQLLVLFSSDEILDNNEFFNDNISDFAKPILLQIRSLLPSAFDVEDKTWDPEKLQAIIAISKEALTEYLSGLEDRNLADLINQFSSLVEFFLRDITSKTSLEKDSPEYYRYRSELAQAVLQNWPRQNGAIQDFDWTQGFILKLQGDAYYQLGEYERAVKTYESAMPLLRKAEEFYTRGFQDSSSSIKGVVAAVKEDPNFSWVEDLIFNQRLYASLAIADAYLELQQPSLAKARYLDALALSNTVSERGFVYQQTERAEIYYGLAQSEVMLGNSKEAQQAIDQAIAIHEESFPNESISGGSGILDIRFNYGYGVPYRGSLSGSFKFESKNPWLTVNASQGLFAEQRCGTVTQYFECRQKYFDFYIGWLLQQHQANPRAGFDGMAFEASEQAKSFSFRRPDSEVSAQDRFAPAQSLREIQAAVGDDNTLVLEYFLGQDTSYLWALGQDGALQVHTLPPRAEIEAQAQAFYDLLTSPTGRVRPQTTAQAGAALSQMILGPVADQLGTQRLVIVADGLLQYLPFAALPNPNPDNLPTASALQGEYGPVLNPLLLDHEIVHLPSASTLVALRRKAPSRPQPTQELAFFANPVFNHKDERVRQVKLFPWSRPFSQAELANIEALYSAIPATERELDSILATNLLPKDKVKTFFGYEANLDAALDSRLGQYRIVHVASHGIFNSNAPERSGVVLSGLSEAGVVQAGLLSPTYAFNDMNLSATELVVLSGCRTGLSQGQIGREGMTGLTNGLFDAGAERVVASLWSVRDDATRELMNRFYRLMLDPENPLPSAQALTEAQRSMWNDPRWQTPYSWAAFTLQGLWE